jgi:hypothetical protein
MKPSWSESREVVVGEDEGQLGRQIYVRDVDLDRGGVARVRVPLSAHGQ